MRFSVVRKAKEGDDYGFSGTQGDGDHRGWCCLPESHHPKHTLRYFDLMWEKKTDCIYKALDCL